MTTHVYPAMTRIRAAFDIGSSQHKLVIAKVYPSRRPHPLYSASVRVPLADNLASDKTLPPAILDQSLNVIKQQLHIARQKGASSFCAIATEVFRVSESGQTHLKSIEALGIRVIRISQYEEGILAFASAFWQASAHPETNQRAVVWDSGGGSTQWTYMRGGKLNVHALQIGSSAVRAAFREMDDHEHAVIKLSKWVMEQAGFPEAGLRRKLSEGVRVFGMGGETCMFAIAAARLGDEFTVDHVWTFVAELVRGEGALTALPDFPHKVLPKMVFLGTLMSTYKIGKVQYVNTNGSCVGLLASEDTRYWGGECLHRRRERIFEEEVQGTSVVPRC